MNRREFLLTTGAVAGASMLPRLAFAEANRIDWYTSSDQNVIDFWTNFIKPTFEAANPGVTINLVDAGDNAGLQAIAQRALAAMARPTPIRRPTSSRTSTPASRSARSTRACGWTSPRQSLSNYSKINPLAFKIDNLTQNLPYRGSQVLLAYDTTKLDPAKAPKTWPDLVAWIKANPGQFIYNRPDKGGSGGNFVRRAIYAGQRQRSRRSSRSTTTPRPRATRCSARAWSLLRTSPPRSSTRAPIPRATPSRSSFCRRAP